MVGEFEMTEDPQTLGRLHQLIQVRQKERQRLNAICPPVVEVGVHREAAGPVLRVGNRRLLVPRQTPGTTSSASGIVTTLIALCYFTAIIRRYGRVYVSCTATEAVQLYQTTGFGVIRNRVQ